MKNKKPHISRIIFISQIIFFSFTSASCAISPIKTENDDFYYSYIFFTNFKPEKDKFEINCLFSSNDGKSTTNYAEYQDEIEVDESTKYSVWKIATPSYARMSEFNLLYDKHVYSSIWVQKIEGCSFEWNASGYHSISQLTGWHPMRITTHFLAKNIISKINPTKKTYNDGFLSYDPIYYSYGETIRTEDLSKETWYDEYIGETSLGKKISIIQSNFNDYKKSTIPHRLVFYFLGAFAFLILILLYFLFIKRAKRWKKK